MRRYVLKNAIGAKRDIRLFAMDVDGVLTDGGMYYSETGDELKKFNTVDGKGIELLRKAGIKTAIVTSENTALVAQRAKKLRVDFLCQGVSDKVSAIRAICRKLDISLENVAYVGDDLNDMKLLEKVGFAACPLNALQAVCDIPGILRLGHKGGDGAVRAFADVILRGME